LRIAASERTANVRSLVVETRAKGASPASKKERPDRRQWRSQQPGPDPGLYAAIAASRSDACFGGSAIKRYAFKLRESRLRVDDRNFPATAEWLQPRRSGRL